MFFITTIFNPGEERERPQKHAPRAFGYFEKEGKAREAVENNYGSIQECLYTHVVIERIDPGIHPVAVQVQWYEWKEDAWKECIKPEWSYGISNYALG